MLTLPEKISTPILKSFWIVLSVSLILFFTVGTFILTGSSYSLLLLLILPVMILLGVINPEIVVVPFTYFRAFYNRLRHLFLSVVLICSYYLIIGTVRLTGASIDKSNIPQNSNWMQKKVTSLTGEDEDVNDLTGIESMSYSHSIKPLINWAVKTNNWWYILTIPILIIFMIFSTEKNESTIPSDTYTLY